MVKKLSVIGNSLGLIIEKPILELLRIERDTPLELSTDGDVLTIRPVRADRRERLRALADGIMDRHDEAFRKLAE
jgi:antitoxin MazE